MGFLFHLDFDAQSSLPFSLYKNRKLHYANNEIISHTGSYISDLSRKGDSFWTGYHGGNWLRNGEEGKLGRRESCISSSACLFSSFSLRLAAYSRISIGSDLIDYCICDRQFSLYSGLGLDLIALCEWRDGVPGSSDV
jgi:hypothetical protein